MRTAGFLSLLILLTCASFGSATISPNPWPGYVFECQEEALEKLQLQASKLQLHVFQETLRVTRVEDDWYNPIYITLWYEADTIGSFVKVKAVLKKFYYPQPHCY